MLRSPIPPNPLPSKAILTQAKTHYEGQIMLGRTRAEYALAALTCFLPIMDAERIKHDSQTSLHWSIESGYTDTYHQFLKLNKQTNDSHAFKELQNALLESRMKVTKLQEQNRYFRMDDLTQIIHKYANMSELEIFVQERMKHDSESFKWWPSSIGSSLDELVRQIVYPESEREKNSRRHEDFPYFFIHKIITIMKIHRHNSEELETWLDWEDKDALLQASDNLMAFLAQIDKELETQKTLETT